MKKYLLTIIILVSALFGTTTGKITGFITDNATGDPLIGCNIIVLGTDLGAATDINGQYFILNVPPGIYDVKALMIGYTPVISKNVEVNVDLTTTIDFQLNIEVIGGEEVTVIAQRPTVKMDLTSSESRVSSDQLEIMPVKEIWDVLAVQSGITKDAGGGIHIRGGRSREVAYWVDGVSVTDAYDGGISVSVDNNSIQELQVISGTFNAEYGQSMSGIINLVTKDGGQKFSGRFSTYGSGFLTDESYLKGLDTYDPLNETNVEFNLSGPVPLLDDRLTFYAYVRKNYNRGWLNAYEIFDQNGDLIPPEDEVIDWYFNGNDKYEPDIYNLNTRDRFNTNLKLTLKVTPKIKLRLSSMTSDEEYQDYRHEAQWCPEGELRRFNSGRNYKASINHQLSSRTFYTFDVTRFMKNYHHFAYESATDSNYIDPYYFLHQEYAVAINSFKMWGRDMSRFERETQTNVAKFDFTTQLDPVNQVKFGAEYRSHQLTLDDYSIQDGDLTDTEFTIAIPGDHDYVEDASTGEWSVLNVSDQEVIQTGFSSKSAAKDFTTYYRKFVEYNRDYYDESPYEFSAYVQDKIEFKSVIINVGLRYDYFNANSRIPTNPAEPYLGNPRNAFIDTLNFEERDNINWSDYASYYEGVLPDSGKELIGKKGWWTDVEAKQQVSPRLGIAYPITDKGVIHFSFGHFFQVPSFERLFTQPGYKMPEGSGSYGVFGNPDLAPQKTVMYELGLKQEIAAGVSIDVTGYYRDVRDWVSTGVPVELLGAASYYQYVNKDYSNIRGLTVNLDRQYRNNYGFNVNYTFQIAEGSNSDPSEEFSALQNNEEPTRAIVALDWDQRHTVNGSFFTGGKSWNFSLLGQFGSGYPYTPSTGVASLSGISTSTDLKTNSRRKPITYNLDVNFLYRLPISQYQAQFTVKILNLLDRRNELTVYGDTGTANSTLDMSGSPDDDRPNTLSDFYARPDWYSAPRQIQLGLEISF